MEPEYGSKDSEQCNEVMAFALAHAELHAVLQAPDCRMLELGCGTGPFGRRFLDEYPNLAVMGVDTSAERIERLQWIIERDGLGVRYQAMVGSILDPGVAPANGFEIVFCPMVLHHFVRLHATALPSNIHGWLKPDGLLLLYEPNGSNPISWVSSLLMRGLVHLIPKWRVYKDPGETVHRVGYYRKTFTAAGFTFLHASQGGDGLLDWDSRALFLVNVRNAIQKYFDRFFWGAGHGTTQLQLYSKTDKAVSSPPNPCLT